VKSIPFVVQLSLIILFILIIPLIVIMSYIGYTTLQYTKEEIASNSLENIELSHRFTENFIDSIAAHIHRLAIFHDFYVYDGLQNYSSIQGNFENIMKIERLQRELQSIARSNSSIVSIFFIFDDADYVISSDRGIIELTDYSSLSWMRSFSAQELGLIGKLVPRVHQFSTIREILFGTDAGYSLPVISYVYTISLISSMKGTIVANISETSIANNLNPGRLDEDSADSNEIIVLQPDGKIISHPQNEYFTTQGRNLPYIAGILDTQADKGYEFIKEGNRQYIYSWYKTDFYDWVFVSVQSINNLLNRSSRMINTMIIISLIVVFLGTIASLVFFSLISRPMRQLVNTVRDNVFTGEKKIRNEMDILLSAFNQIESKGKELKDLLNEREKDAALLAMRNIIFGEKLNSQDAEILEQVLPYKLFMVAHVSLDNYEEYNRRNNTEERSYHRFMFISKAEETFNVPFVMRAIHLYGAQVALIINFSDEAHTAKIAPLLKKLQETAFNIFKTTVTIGISETGFNIDAVQTCSRQASEAVTMRMFQGSGNIIFWTYKEGIKRFYYPQNSEAKVLNYLSSGNIDLIKHELDKIQENIRLTSGISYDNICFIYNQLAGVTIKKLSEINFSTSGFFFDHGNVYKSIASCETLEQLNRYMGDFYGGIVSYFHKDKEEEKPIDLILACFEKHYRDDIFFEDIAAELGMSYSYMRRIVKSSTGKSVIDTINFLRIQEAKTLLLDDKIQLEKIAKRVGYRNIQSLKRYFRKFEGLNPLDYRLVNKINKSAL